MSSRVTLQMSLRDVVMALAGGNPGALNVCMSIVMKGAEIDPDSALGPLGALLSLDQHRIYGSEIWMLFKDVCGQSLPKMLACLRAVQLGGLAGVTSEALLSAIQNRGAGVDAAAALAAVKERLPRFDAVAVESAPAVRP